MDMTLNEVILLTSTSWTEKYQPLTSDMTKDKNTGRYRLGLNSMFVPDSSLFYIIGTHNFFCFPNRDIFTIIFLFILECCSWFYECLIQLYLYLY